MMGEGCQKLIKIDQILNFLIKVLFLASKFKCFAATNRFENCWIFFVLYNKSYDNLIKFLLS